MINARTKDFLRNLRDGSPAPVGWPQHPVAIFAGRLSGGQHERADAPLQFKYRFGAAHRPQRDRVNPRALQTEPGDHPRPPAHEPARRRLV